MHLRKKSFQPGKNKYHKALRDAQVYLVLDTQVQSYDRLFEIAQEAVVSGVKILQLRDKNGLAKDILSFMNRFREFLDQNSLSVPLIINDRVDLALASSTAGVHLGQDDLPIFFARQVLGKQSIIGISCQSLKQAQVAQDQGADYIGFGSVFKTKTKPRRSEMDLELLEKVVRTIQIPVFAIGGINEHNIQILSSRGITRIAVCRALCEAKNIQVVLKRFRDILNHKEGQNTFDTDMRG